jgi:hypothetical protein
MTYDPLTLHAELCRLVGPMITHYRGDLTTHDRDALLANRDHPPAGIIHGTRPTGTTIAVLYRPDDPRWPARGERIPWLFGEATREQIADDRLATVEYMARREPHFLHQWSPIRPHDWQPADSDQVVRIAESWRELCRATWARMDSGLLVSGI